MTINKSNQQEMFVAFDTCMFEYKNWLKLRMGHFSERLHEQQKNSIQSIVLIEKE